FPDFSAITNVALARQVAAGHSFRFFRAAERDRSLTEPALETIARVGLENRASALARELSHGERRQLELAMALAGGPRLILLDEPMAGMGGQDSARMKRLKSGPTSACATPISDTLASPDASRSAPPRDVLRAQPGAVRHIA